jgi:myosin-5
VGSILVAVNPFRPLPHLFSGDVLAAHMANTTSAVKAGSAPARMSPHVYGIACNAYTQMMRDHLGQSILVSGCAWSH